MRFIMILAAFFMSFNGCKNCDCEKAIRDTNPNLVKVDTPRTDTVKTPNNLMVSIDENNKLFIDSKAVAASDFDSLLSLEIQLARKNSEGQVTVIISADPAAYYSEVFRIMRAAKKDSAKVVANINDR